MLPSRFRTPFASIASVLPLSRLWAMTRLPVLYPLYHIVDDLPCPHVRHLYTVRSMAAFTRDVEDLLQYFEPLTLEQAVTYDGRRPGIHFTFDDGLRQCNDVIAPILRHLQVPATFFINAAFIDNQGLMYRYQDSLLIDALSTASMQQGTSVAAALGVDVAQDQIATQVARLTYHDSDLRRELAIILGVDFKAFLHDYKPYMTAHQVRSLRRQGFSIGDHSCSHPLYSSLTTAQQLEQTLTSMELLRLLLTDRPISFAFPFTDDGVITAFWEGLYLDYPQIVTFGTAGIKHDPQRRHLQRLPMEVGVCSAMEVVRAELLYYLLKMPLYRNRMTRL